jgi:hypothetical protein
MRTVLRYLSYLDKCSHFSIDVANERRYFRKLDIQRMPILGVVSKLLSLEALAAEIFNKISG